ncbi:MAG: N-acetyltransferase family protein [Candidatus Hodarchaeales archaeon]|jgi:GNAT superfamily N-acetyltransferase
MNSHSIKVFDPPAEADNSSLLDNFYQFYLAFTKEIYPNDPSTPKARLIKSLKDPHPHYHIYHWLVYDSNSIVIGWTDCYISKESHPAYETNKHIAECEIILLKDYRRRGIGTKLLSYLILKAKEYNRSLIQGGSNQESGHEFCLKYGGTVAIHGSENRLQMSSLDWNMIRDWIEEGPIRAEGVTLEQFVDVPEEDIEEYCIIYTETMNQQPFGELEGRAKITPESRRMSEKRLRKREGIWTTLISREKDRTISGLTEVFYFPDKPIMLNQNLTGVKEKFRGRGLGKWLKAAMLEWVKEEYPKVQTIITGNATTNAPMLAINKRLGFKEYKSGTAYKFPVDELSQKVSI